MKLWVVISLRNALPIWAIPNGGFLRANWSTFLKFTKMPWAVSGRRNTSEPSSCTGPTWVWNIRLKLRGSDRSPPHSGHFSSPSGWASRRWSSRQRFLHFPRHCTSGSVKPSRWPEASHVRGCIRIAASRATMSSRSCRFARHHSALTLFFSSTP